MVVKTIKKDYAGTAAPTPKNPNLLIFLVDDIQTFPARDENSIKSNGNLVLKDGKKCIGLYVTQQTLNRSDAPDGDYPATGFICTVSGDVPGDKLALNELVQNLMNKDLILITRGCEDELATRLHGAICAPMSLSAEEQDNNDGTKKTLTFKQTNRYKYKSMHYTGSADFTMEDDAVDNAVNPEGGA